MTRTIQLFNSSIVQAQEGEKVRLVAVRTGDGVAKYRDTVDWNFSLANNYLPETRAEYGNSYYGTKDVEGYGGSFTFEPGEKYAFSTFDVNADWTIEDNEYVNVALSNWSTSSEYYDADAYVNGGAWIDDWYNEPEIGNKREIELEIQDVDYKTGLLNADRELAAFVEPVQPEPEPVPEPMIDVELEPVFKPGVEPVSEAAPASAPVFELAPNPASVVAPTPAPSPLVTSAPVAAPAPAESDLITGTGGGKITFGDNATIIIGNNNVTTIEVNVVGSDGRGKDRLVGTDSEDRFEITGDGKDKIINFNESQDTLVIDNALMGSSIINERLYVADSKQQLKAWKNNSFKELIYWEDRGRLYFNDNIDDRGWGKNGGLIAKFDDAPDFETGKTDVLVEVLT